ncbi:MAG: hypothetical protein CTY15_13735 [Methylocystis sp.]|nr:MAG: hypothetical protein CTY15_13735 [Methylocystis sp.]
MTARTDQVLEAHERCSMHKDEILGSRFCGCFSCLGVYPPSRIEDWCDDGDTALCPVCGVDSIIGDRSGLPAADANFLSMMKSYWFGSAK